jgi:hypothetical protein
LQAQFVTASNVKKALLAVATQNIFENGPVSSEVLLIVVARAAGVGQQRLIDFGRILPLFLAARLFIDPWRQKTELIIRNHAVFNQKLALGNTESGTLQAYRFSLS